jgi:hypothetical protein
MEPEGSLPGSERPDTGPYLEPTESSPETHTLFRFVYPLYYPPMYAWVFQIVSSLQILRSTYPAHLILLDLVALLIRIFDEDYRL